MNSRTLSLKRTIWPKGASRLYLPCPTQGNKGFDMRLPIGAREDVEREALRAVAV